MPVHTIAQLGKLIIYPEQVENDRLTVFDVINDNQVNFIKLTPSHLSLLIGMDLTGSSLETVITGGETLKTNLARQVTAAFGEKTSLYNSYGPTETTANCMFHRYSPTEDNRETVPIGRPIDNIKIYILDLNLQPVPVGVTGEIYIGGHGLSDGYLNQPELTAEKFIVDPFSSMPSDRLYKSGDLARYLPDGEIEFRGRIDNQIKLRGYRIEPDEIEAVLEDHPAVIRALVQTDTPQDGDIRLIAYTTVTKQGNSISDELRTWLTSKIPAHTIPEVIFPLARFPLTTNGKIDTRALPTPARSRPSTAGTPRPPRTPIEIELVRIWQEILNINPVGIHDNILELGAHSLLIARAATRINETYSTNLHIRRLFEYPTIEALAIVLTEHLMALTEDNADDLLSQ